MSGSVMFTLFIGSLVVHTHTHPQPPSPSQLCSLPPRAAYVVFTWHLINNFFLKTDKRAVTVATHPDQRGLSVPNRKALPSLIHWGLCCVNDKCGSNKAGVARLGGMWQESSGGSYKWTCSWLSNVSVNKFIHSLTACGQKHSFVWCKMLYFVL